MNGNLIDREALREDLRRFFPAEVLEGIEPKTLFAQIMHDIDNAPTVSDRYDEGYTQGTCDCEHAHERPQGEWKFSQGITTQGSLKCPFCDYRDYHNTNSNYCPNCGAKLGKGGAENDK